MIKNTIPLSMAESINYIKKSEKSDTDVVGFIKKFIKLKSKDAQSLRKKIEDLDFIKVRSEHIVKIIDFLPENTEELQKIFVDISLNEDETNKILDKVKEFK